VSGAAALSCDFRTFQVYPKDLRALPVHPEPAVSWHSGFRGGAHARLRRRQFITLLGGVAAAWPLAARAQQSVALVGLLSGTQLDDRLIEAIRQGFKDGGYIEGRNLAIKYRSADGRFDRLPALANALVTDSAAAIIALAPPAALAAKAATTTIPIVFATGAEPVAIGLVPSLNRPGANVTGVTFVVTSLGAKRLELLRQLMPSATVVSFLINPRNPTSEAQITDVQAAARALGVELLILHAGSEPDIDAAFTRSLQQHANAMIVGADAFFTSRLDQLVGLASRDALPTIFYLREFAALGGLISYGASITDAYRLAAGYAGRILKGEKPGDLPVQQTVKFELAIKSQDR
jgi:putative tryptophan/tyrosine transport system substrate-binding protein